MVKTQDADLEWFILQGDATMGARSTLASTVNQLECGGPSEGARLGEDGAYIHPFTDQQLGTGRCTRGDVERHRWLSRAWFVCSEQARGLLLLAHRAPPGEYRSDSGYGAADRYVKGSDRREGRHGQKRTGVDAQLGFPVDTEKSGMQFGIAALAIALSPDPGKLLVACHDPAPLHKAGRFVGKVNHEEAARRRQVIREAKRRAEEAVEPAWAEWWAAKAAADPMRFTRDRRSHLPEYLPAEATVE